MTHSLFFKVTRPVAIATVAGAALFAMPAMAQQTKEQATKPPAADAATSNKPETVEQRITTLKAEGAGSITEAIKVGEWLPIKIDDQEKKWNGVAQAMRDNASRMEKLVAEKRKIPPEKTTAVDDLKTYQEFTETRLDGLKHLTSAFKSLYDTMTPEQKKNADTVFERYKPQQPKQG